MIAKYSQYLNIKKELYKNLLDYIDNETEADNITFYHYLDNINNRQEMILFFGFIGFKYATIITENRISTRKLKRSFNIL